MKTKLFLIFLSLFWTVQSYASFKEKRKYHLNKTITLLANCNSPDKTGVKDIKSNEVTIYWEDDVNTMWEYFVIPAGDPIPSSYNVTNNKEETITQDASGNNLQPNTEYEYYVRTDCGGGVYGSWEVFTFRTDCAVISLPFTETFELTSPTVYCWKIVDTNEDASSTVQNIWNMLNNGSFAYEGNYSVSFQTPLVGGAFRSAKTGDREFYERSDDWLISPSFDVVNTEIYEVSYYLLTTPKFNDNTADDYNNEFEILLSDKGTDIADFTTVLKPKQTYYERNYVKQKFYIQNTQGTINIAWHISSLGANIVRMDYIHIKKVDCIGPDESDINLDRVEIDKATFSWKDDNNTEWEYYVQYKTTTKPPTPPAGGGNLTKNKAITVTKSGGASGPNLLPDTEYEFWLRSTCGLNSSWVGPVYFKTPCLPVGIPFWEGFNAAPFPPACWTVLDNNQDGTTFTGTGLFNAVEGNGAMMFMANNIAAKSVMPPQDEWLISPDFNLDPTKFYKLKYHFKTNQNYAGDRKTLLEADFEVRLSDKGGINPEDFTKVLLSRKGHRDNTYREEVLYVGGLSGNVSIAWHLTSAQTENYFYVDNVFFEEVSGCLEPVVLGVKDEQETQATIYWTDDFGEEWEYVVQPKNGYLPTNLGNTATTKRENTITKDKFGNALVSNTEYEFFVRTKCIDGSYSTWSGPFYFKTTCGVFLMPFYESFNLNTITTTFPCWTIVDNNDDTTDVSGSYLIWGKSGGYEGTGMEFRGNETDAHDDWLISPQIKMETGKTYRLKFYSRAINGNNYYEVLLSDKGTDVKDFTHSVIPKRDFASDAWQQETAFISGINGEINIAWHIPPSDPDKGKTVWMIDEVFVDEVKNCPEPSYLYAEDITSNSASLFWTDDTGGSGWEYYVQPAGGTVPSGSGTFTNSKKNTVTQDNSGNTLTANTDYEYYVRTRCADGTHSIWAGPYMFITSCVTLTTPFWEGFNTDSKTARCWTILDNNADGNEFGGNIWRSNFGLSTYQVYEGDRVAFFAGTAANTLHDDWLISPEFELENDLYVLKYHYNTTTTANYENEFEVLLSEDGTDPVDFKQVLLSSKKYINDNWVEEVIFFTAPKGKVHIAWHITSAKNTYVYIDNVSLEKVATCPEPYKIETIDYTANSIDIEWQQTMGITEWEVLIVEYGYDETGPAVYSTTVTGVPKTTLTGLDGGKAYTIYIRAKCTVGNTVSEWSTGAHAVTKIGANDDCDGAIDIPVNPTNECVQTVSGTFLGAIPSVTPIIPNVVLVGGLPFMTLSCGGSHMVNDIWYKFTATSNAHEFSIEVSTLKSALPASTAIYAAIYRENTCGAINANSMPIVCFPASYVSMPFSYPITGLTPGNTYYVRLGVQSPNKDFIFTICMTTPQAERVSVSAAGDKYTTEELVKDVLIQSDCDLVSNVKAQVGDGSPETQSVNGVGYFNRNGADFPFEEGIVLCTNEVEYVPGPYQQNSPGFYFSEEYVAALVAAGVTSSGLAFGNGPFRGYNPYQWVGDDEINEAIHNAGGAPDFWINHQLSNAEKRITQLTFDFIPVKDSIQFEYLFAYTVSGGCDSPYALFITWLTDSETGEGQNLAKIPNTYNTPIASNTIGKLNCVESYPEYKWKVYSGWYGDGPANGHPLEAPVDFTVLTVPMLSEKVAVVPGRKYHIKMAVIDFKGGDQNAAVFFNANSFDLGSFDLGEDWLIENQSALCYGESRKLISGVVEYEGFNTEFQWYKDGVPIQGANTPGLEINEAGEYRLDVKFLDIDCERTDSIVVEMYPPISSVVNIPQPISVCRTSLEDVIIDFEDIETDMFAQSSKEIYTTAYFRTMEDAEALENVIADTKYSLGKEPQAHTLYIRIENTQTGCHEVFALPIEVEQGAIPNKPENVSVCTEYVFPQVERNQYYYTEPHGVGKFYKKGDILAELGEHTIYVLQINNEEGCYEEISYQVNITAPVTADIFEDKTLSCEYYQLKPLSEHSQYFTESEGKGEELYPGMQILHKQTVYVYASSEDSLCSDESSFTIDYEDCPIPRGISPNGDDLNDVFDLTPHGVENIKIYNRWGTEVYSHGEGYTTQWHGQSKSGKQLPDGTYYYVIHAHGKVRTGWVQINK